MNSTFIKKQLRFQDYVFEGFFKMFQKLSAMWQCLRNWAHMWDSLKSYLHGFQIPLEGRVCAAVEQTFDCHLLSSIQYVFQKLVGVNLGSCVQAQTYSDSSWSLLSLCVPFQFWHSQGFGCKGKIVECLVAPQCLNRKQMTVFPQRKEWVKAGFVSFDTICLAGWKWRTI